MKKEITIEQFKKLLPKICDRETSSDPKGWTPENPLWGHCAVVALITQDIFGGRLLRASLAGTEFSNMGSHYWNLLIGATEQELDFTQNQFGSRYPKNLKAEGRARKYVLYDPLTGKPREIMKRYKLLKSRLSKN